MRLDIKPLSVNEAYTGRRKKTDKHRSYRKEVLFMLQNRQYIPDGKLWLQITFGFSSKGSDVDNCAKAFIDCLQEKYQFNDNRIYQLDLKKADVEKGNEFIVFTLSRYHE